MDQSFHLEPHKLALQEYLRVMWRLQSRRLFINSVAVSFLFALSLRGMFDWSGFDTPDIIYLVIFLISAPLILWLHYALIRARYKARGNEALYLTRYVTLEDKRFEITIENNFQSFIPFNTLMRVIETQDYYLIYTSALQILIFPKFIFKKDSEDFFRQRVNLPAK